MRTVAELEAEARMLERELAAVEREIDAARQDEADEADRERELLEEQQWEDDQDAAFDDDVEWGWL